MIIHNILYTIHFVHMNTNHTHILRDSHVQKHPMCFYTFYTCDQHLPLVVKMGVS